MRITESELRGILAQILERHGLAPAAADEAAEIFTANTIDGVASHGVNRFPRVIRGIAMGHIRPDAVAAPVASLGALERWDGNLGVGVLNAKRCTARVIELARANGIGCVALRNTNHWMRGGYYGWRIAEQGCIGLLWTNTMPNMPPWGAADSRIGNNPLVVAVPHAGGHIVFDAAMAQFSYGKLESTARAGEQLPFPGGFDAEGTLTTDPQAILQSTRVLPTGYWKGSGLAIVLDLAASVLSEGQSTRALGTLGGEEYGVSQLYLAIDAQRATPGFADELIAATVADLKASNRVAGVTEIRYPGEREQRLRAKHRAEGVEVHDTVWQQITALL